ncbi:MAG: DUF5108 domain-containing protein [Bacteroides sp.]|nr:DUF5108 domain-containing protein [Bacteroides sp.]MCM1390973.1 DUF5108 domain-containing protein [Bacteroides sp.]
MKTKNLLKALFTVALMATTLASCDSDVFNINADPFKGQKYKDDLTSPISIYLEGEADFSEYVKALRYSGTFNALNQSTSGVSFTALAPNNEAMRDFYRRRGVDSLEVLSPEYVKEFVLYHTLKDSISADQFVTKSSVTNISGETLNITIDAENSGEAMIGPEGRIVEMGISAYNGKIYVMSSALTPLVETVYDRVVENGASSIMLEAIEASGWKKDLQTIADTIIENGFKRVVNRYYTFLNVNDATFSKAGINNLADLRAKLSERNDRDITADSLLREYVSYHIMNAPYGIADFGDAEGEDIVTKLLGTMANNQTMMLAINPVAIGAAEKYTFNHQDESARFMVNESDVRAKNGYLHTIDSWLPVWEPDQTEVVWDLADYAEIRALLAGSEYYQPAEPVAKETSISINKAACFTYVMGDGGTKNNSYSDITYVTTKSYRLMAPLAGQYSTAVNNDRVVFNLGYMGSVEMTTPTIVKGKYRVEVSIGYMSTHSFMRTQSDGNGGLLKVSFDDDPAATGFASPYTTVTNAYLTGGIFTTQLFEEVEFNETTSHNFKMIIMDPAASSNRSFSIQIDCIRFIPIQ